MTKTWLRSMFCSAAAAAMLFTAPAFADLSVGGTDDKGGSITGVTKFVGEKKPRKALEMASDAYCLKAHKEPVLSERWVFGKDDGLANVLVYVVKGPGVDGKKFTAPSTPVLIDQVGCMYVPHVTACMAGQKVQLRNSDSTLHNLHGLPKTNDTGNKEFNVGQPAKGMVHTESFKPELGLFVKCDVHAWMSSYVNVMTNPYFAVTDKDGNFTIKGLPAGDYELKVWHEVKAFQPTEEVIKVTVKDEGATKAEIVISPKAPR